MVLNIYKPGIVLSREMHNKKLANEHFARCGKKVLPWLFSFLALIFLTAIFSEYLAVIPLSSFFDNEAPKAMLFGLLSSFTLFGAVESIQKYYCG